MSREVCGICWCPYDEDGGCGCKPAQPKAMRIADQLEDAGIPAWVADEAATELRRLHAENEALQKALRRVIRTYRVADEVWDPDAETERLYQLEIQK